MEWVAGPYLNLSNSFSLECLKQEFGCRGAFISNELNKKQIKPIIRPSGFELHHSIYHPIMILMSRQCLFHQTVGCKVKAFDSKCLKGCKKTASIINMRESSFIIDKQKGDHNAMYSQFNFMNTDIITDMPDKFSHYFVDLRDIKTDTQISVDKATLIGLFTRAINKDETAIAELSDAVTQTSNAQYRKGL
nr:U32 family peptidase [Photobacterium swingsii]